MTTSDEEDEEKEDFEIKIQVTVRKDKLYIMISIIFTILLYLRFKNKFILLFTLCNKRL